MSTDDTPSETDEHDEQRDQTPIRLDSVEVASDGRVTIPHRIRERFGIEAGDYVDMVLLVDDDE